MFFSSCSWLSRSCRLGMVALLFGVVCSGEWVEYHVSHAHGSDDNPGAVGAPFQTLHQAFKQYRALLRSGSYPSGGVRIVLDGGVHVLGEGILLELGEGVPAGSHLVIDGGGKAVLTGGRVLSRADFRPVTDTAVLSRLQPKARGHVMELDLKGVGCWSQAPDILRGGEVPWGLLTVNGRALPVSRWPNEGWGAVKKVLARGSHGGHQPQSGVGVFTCGEEVPLSRWAGCKELWLHGFWSHDWYDEVIRCSAVDLPHRRVSLRTSGSAYGLGSAASSRFPRRFAVLNLLEELDREGEWCLERGSGKLYAWLPVARPEERMVFATLTEPMFKTLSCSKVEFRGLTFEGSRGGALDLRGDGNRILGCVFRNLGGYGIRVSGRGNLISGCDLHDLGETGVILSGGDRRTLARGDNVVENCHIWRIGQLRLGYSGAIRLKGVGQIVRRNLLHDLPHSAIFYGGNEHVIELNDIFGCCLDTADSGALYTGRSWGSQGNRVKHNYIHHNGGIGGWSMGVYLDDCDSGDTIDGNLFVEVPRAVFIGGGRYNRVTNNLFIDCSPAVHLDDRGVQRIVWQGDAGDSWNLAARLKALKYQESPWRETYPHLVNILSDRPALPLHNVVECNILVGGSGFSMKNSLRALLKPRFNWFAEEASEVGFRGIEAGDYRFRDSGLVRSRVPGFRSLPLEQIGLRRDANRTSLPDARALLSRSLRERGRHGQLAKLEKKAAVSLEKTVTPQVKVPRSLSQLIMGASEADIRVDGVLEQSEWSAAVTEALVWESGAPAGRKLGFRVMATPRGLCLGLSGLPEGGGKAPGKPAWGRSAGVQVSLRPRRFGPVLVFRGYRDGLLEYGEWDGSAAGLSARAVPSGVSFKASSLSGGTWGCEWLIPWGALGGRPGLGVGMGFNLDVCPGVGGARAVWRPTGTVSHDVGRAGYVVMP